MKTILDNDNNGRNLADKSRLQKESLTDWSTAYFKKI